MRQYLKMLKLIILSGFVISMVACQSSAEAGKKPGKVNDGAAAGSNTTSENSINKVSVNMVSGASYRYTITNESETEVEANDKKVNNQHKSDVTITYNIQKDSTGNYLLRLHYDKIHLYSKTGDQEVEMDAANADKSINPTEKMLGILKNSSIAATVSATGKVIAISGYKELGDKILAGLSGDEKSLNMAKGQWEKVIGEGMVKKSIEQLFSVLPDRKIQVGDTWKKNAQQTGEFNLNVASTFRLKDIEDGIASIASEGELTSSKGESQLMGYSVTSDLQGDQDGEYEVDTKTGMVLKNTTISKIKGTLQMLGKEIPVTMKTTLKMNGKKM
jgi:hypothetical protein